MFTETCLCNSCPAPGWPWGRGYKWLVYNLFTILLYPLFCFSRESVRSEVFGLLKPVCVQLTKDHSRANISNLFTALRSVDIVFLQDLQEYVLFPLRVILKHPKKW